MCVKVLGREVEASTIPTQEGYFFKCDLTVGFGLQVGSVVEVDEVACRVRYLIEGTPSEPEVWALLTPSTRK